MEQNITPTSGNSKEELYMTQEGGATTINTSSQALSDITIKTNGYRGRYVRFRPSTDVADGYIHFSQLMVFDINGKNLALGRPTFASSSMKGTAPSSILVDGSTVKRVNPNIWHLSLIHISEPTRPY